MIDPLRRRRLIGAALYSVIVLALLLIRLVPFAPGRIGWPGPDLGICVTLAWVLRRPEQISAPLIAVLFFVADLVLFRPPGLVAALAVLASEAARARQHRWRELPFVVEWLRVAILIAMMMFAYRVALGIVFVPLPSLGQVILEFLATVIAYPVVVAVLRRVFGLTRADYIEATTMRLR